MRTQSIIWRTKKPLQDMTLILLHRMEGPYCGLLMLFMAEKKNRKYLLMNRRIYAIVSKRCTQALN